LEFVAWHHESLLVRGYCGFPLRASGGILTSLILKTLALAAISIYSDSLRLGQEAYFSCFRVLVSELELELQVEQVTLEAQYKSMDD
jgi:hypothetical protein